MNKGSIYSNEELLGMMQAGPTKRRQAIAYIFEQNKAKSCAYLISRGATTDQADDILQEAMLILIRQLENGKYVGKNQATVHTYFIGICKHLLLAQQRKKKKEELLPVGKEIGMEDSPLEKEERKAEQFRLHQCLKQLGEVCRKILLLRSESPPVPWQELALEFGYKDAQNAMNKGGKCMKQLRKLYFSQRI